MLVAVLFDFDFTALSGIWEAAPLAATCASTSPVPCKYYLWVTEGESIECFYRLKYSSIREHITI